MNQNYQMQPVASGLAGLGRGGDSMLVHMQPREVAGLQSLAMAHGGSLTINPHTGLPEAGFLGDILGVIAPIALGTFLGPGAFGITGLGMTGLQAGLATGALGWALTGDPLKGLSAGLGAASGVGLGKSIAEAGITKAATSSALPETLMDTAKSLTPVEAVSSSMINNPGSALSAVSGANPALSSSVLNPSAASAFGVPNAAAQPLTNAAAYSMPSANQLAAGITNTAGKSAIDLAATQVAESAPSFSQGVKNIMADPWKFIKNNPGTTAGVALPLLGALNKPQTLPTESDKPLEKYKGPYKLVRDVSFPTDRDPNDSSEYMYFKNPRILAAGEYAAGGQVDTYNPDNPGAATNLSRDGYGLASFRMQNPDPQPFQIAQQPSPMTYARGGYLDGPGDGMSDSIPATIANKQPARLADGEFVVPADVVSHIGNGSTKAGAQRLYAMMDKVRKARTGTTKQGRQINPHKFLPA
jgi:hypothetical protein